MTKSLRIFSILLIFLVFPAWAWSTTYYCNANSSGGYVDPVGNTWDGGSDSNNGTSYLTPKQSFYACVSAVGNANNNTLILAPGTYNHSSSLTQLTTANKTGIVMEGADPNPANWPIVDGSGLTGGYAVFLRGQTTVQYMEFRNCNLTANYVNQTSALAAWTDASDIVVQNCRFRNNYSDIFARSTSSITIKYSIFADTSGISVHTDSGFTGSGADLNIFYNKFYGTYLGLTNNRFVRLTGSNSSGDTNPIVNVYNNGFYGGDSDAIYVDASYYGHLNAKNNDFRGLTSYAVNCASPVNVNYALSNNSYITGGWPASSYVSLTNVLHGCSVDFNSITDQLLYSGSRGMGYIIFRKDDTDTSTTNLNYAIALAQKLQSYGWSLTYGAVVAEAVLGSVNLGIHLTSVSGSFSPLEGITQAVSGATATVSSWDPTNGALYITAISGTFDTTHTVTGFTSHATGIPTDPSMIVYQTRQLISAGAELANHTYSHAALTNTVAFTIAYTGGGTWSLSTTSSGSVPNDAESLTVTESTSELNSTIDLVAGTITGDTWDQSLHINNLTSVMGVRNYLASKGFFTVGTISTTNCSAFPDYLKSRSIGTVNFSGAGTKTVLLDSTRLRYYEINDAAAWWAALGITLSKTLIYPFFLYDASTITDAMTYGYTAGLQNSTTGSYSAVGAQLKQLQMFEIPMVSMLDTMNLSDANLQIWARQVCEALPNQLKVITIMTHGPDQGWTAAQQDIVFQEIKRHPNVRVVSTSQLQNIVANSGLWSTADGGKTYTRSTWTPDDLFSGPDAPSALIYGGTSVSLTTDFNGLPTPILGAPGPSIGPYEPWMTGQRKIF